MSRVCREREKAANACPVVLSIPETIALLDAMSGATADGAAHLRRRLRVWSAASRIRISTSTAGVVAAAGATKTGRRSKIASDMQMSRPR